MKESNVKARKTKLLKMLENGDLRPSYEVQKAKGGWK